ncbi:sodium-coupled monocarboxylate transporter 1-like [Chironomus tepperi]|uniref:sodium-coupled monocarboxylate transporter 1-like n=1 Tax=Chironomus tepperi TaxID=113505 RepID=UPI00391F98FD
MDVSTEKSLNYFTVIDYGVFVAMLLLSALIGVYFGFISKKKQNNTSEYLLGSKKMGFFPVAASLIASHISASTLLALPAEIYHFGSEYIWSIASAILTGCALIHVFLPVFYGLQVTSAFQYLELRFNRNVRLVASLIFALTGITFIPVVVYVPALALSQVSGINLHLITTFTSIICIFYTTFGGLKAVLWTDTLQLIMMIGGIVCVMFLGLSHQGGFSEVLKTAYENGRLDLFNMNPSPFVRTSFWTYIIGLSFGWTAKLGVSQCCVQRFLSVPNIHVAKKAVYVFVIGYSLIKITSVMVGITIYAKYASCDPIISEKIQKIDQILPLFVMEVASKIPGLPGIFIAGVFSASLSSMSSNLNTIAGALYEDFIRHKYPNLSEKRASDIMKILVLIIGIISLGLVFVVEHMGQIFRVCFTINGLSAGALFGLFTAGMFSKTINTKGVITGAISSIVVLTIIILGSLALPKPVPLPISTSGCDYPYNNTMVPSNLDDKISADNIPIIFKLSFMYYILLGTIVLFLVAIPVSHMTGNCEPFDERLLAPICRSKNWKEKSRKELESKKMAKSDPIYELKSEVIKSNDSKDES